MSRAPLALAALLTVLPLGAAHRAFADAPPAVRDELAEARAMIATDDLEKHQAAERFLRRHLRRAPRDVEARMLLGRLLLVQGKPGDARTAFRQALRLDPTRRDARREIGLVWQREWARFFERKLLERSVDELVRGVPPAGVAPSPDDWSGLAALGLLLCESGFPDRALQMLEPRVTAAGDAADAWGTLALAVAYHGTGRLADAERAYAAGIRRLGPLDRDGYMDVRPVAFEAERDAFSQLRLEERPDWLRTFWAAHDPTSTTPINEFQLEFYRRVTCAFLYFRLPGARWWDARGDVYVRFGPPDVVDTVEGHLIDAAHDFETMEILIPDQVLWKYGLLGMDVRLAETSFNGLYTFPFPTRTTVTNPYLTGYVGPYAARKGRERGEYAWDPATEWLQRRAQLREQRAEAILDRGGFIVRIDFQKNVVALSTSHAAFAGDGGRVRVDVAVGALQRALRAARPKPRGTPKQVLADTTVWGELAPAPPRPREAGPLAAAAVLYDAAWREVARTDSKGPFVTTPTVDGPMTVARLTLDAPPGHYYLATSMEDSAIVGAHREGARAPDFPNGFAISEIELALPRAGTAQPAFGPSLAIPNPSRTVGDGQPLAIYFEAYNLSRDLRGQARVAVRSTIRLLDDGARVTKGSLRRKGGIVTRTPVPAVVSTQFEDVARASTLTRSFEVNVDRLEPGEYEALLTVTDLGTGLEASERTTFRKSADRAR